MTEREILDSLGLDKPLSTELPAVVNKVVNRIDLSQALKMRYHNRLTYQDIGDKFGVSAAAVCQRIKDFEAQIGDPEELRTFTDLEGEIQSAIKRRFSSELLKVDLSKSSPKDLAITYGVIYDKHRLQTGQSTNNTSIFFAVVAESDQADTTKCGIEGEVIEADTSDQA